MARSALCGVAALLCLWPAPIAAGQATPAPADDPPKPSRESPEPPERAKSREKRPRPPVEYPHPMITEVHYAVRSGDEGDANGDGDRDAIGDEFVEIINPHPRTIQLKGCMLVDSDAWAKSKNSRAARKSRKSDGVDEVRFVFPDLELKPGQIAVVFNGYRQNTPGPVGTSARAAGRNARFHDAYVFTMNVGSKYAAFDNGGDWVMLVDAKGLAVECVGWGQPDHEAPRDVRRSEAPIDIHASAQRDGVTGPFRSHESLPAPLGELRFSPGRFDLPTSGDGAGEKKRDGDAEEGEGEGSNEESESKRAKSGDR
ncbi:MAG: lamin tail domain-containing protein [Phycisphaerales bacterium]|nr:lamin tail domain-containing protein [Phycisphaerales bacterium]